MRLNNNWSIDMQNELIEKYNDIVRSGVIKADSEEL